MKTGHMTRTLKSHFPFQLLLFAKMNIKSNFEIEKYTKITSGDEMFSLLETISICALI